MHNIIISEYIIIRKKKIKEYLKFNSLNGTKMNKPEKDRYPIR